MVVTRAKQESSDAPEELARRLLEALTQERVIPRFVDSYVVENGRHSLQVHASLYKDLLALLQREALLAASARALEITAFETVSFGRNRQQQVERKGAATYRRKYLAALTNRLGWSVGDALDFQSDLQRYEELLARNSTARRARKPFEAANHPFVDRCAFVLDSSFMEKARLAASRTLAIIEDLVDRLTGSATQR